LNAINTPSEDRLPEMNQIVSSSELVDLQVKVDIQSIDLSVD